MIVKCECGKSVETSAFWANYMAKVGRTDMCGEH